MNWGPEPAWPSQAWPVLVVGEFRVLILCESLTVKDRWRGDPAKNLQITFKYHLKPTLSA